MNMRHENDDSKLSAFIDGELDERETEALTARLADEPALRARLEAMRAADEATRKVFATLDERPLPQGVMDLLGASAAAPGGDNVVAFPQRGIRRFFQAPVAIAASVALVAGFLVSRQLEQVPDAGLDAGLVTAGVVDADSALHGLLETGSSGEERPLGADARGRVLLTVADASGDYCRQFVVEGAGRAAHAVACRRAGDWELEAVGFAPAAAPGTFQQAAGPVPPAVDATVDAITGGSDPLSLEEENRVISESWEKSAR
ncbi:MAG: hypothetical protein R3176_03265 [Woeseiaceae bacterium]|nr:hypothetical protein [Woeseiaceae bacterium]